jgi:predicted type IV restriction endonuclease
MDLIDQLQSLSARILKQLNHLQTEEATKTALVMPFINALGYNVFDPTEVVPEFTADVATKKGEKVDYAIFVDGKPAILFECKWSGADLNKEHAAQLQRYFHVTDARFAILTNGILYRFYTDLEQPNKMDAKPFFEFNMLDVKEAAVEELKRFSRSKFHLEALLSAAGELKYTKEVKRLMAEQFSAPSEEFVRFFAKQVYPGTLTANAKAQFTEIVQRAAHQLTSDQIGERLRVALGEEKVPALAPLPPQLETQVSQTDEASATNQGIVTTEEELEGYYIVKAILCSVIDPARVKIRDVQSYCGILLDDNNRKPICRLHFNFSQKYIGLFDEAKNEERLPIDKTDEIYKFAERLRSTVTNYDAGAKTPKNSLALAQTE